MVIMKRVIKRRRRTTTNKGKMMMTKRARTPPLPEEGYVGVPVGQHEAGAVPE